MIDLINATVVPQSGQVARYIIMTFVADDFCCYMTDRMKSIRLAIKILPLVLGDKRHQRNPVRAQLTPINFAVVFKGVGMKRQERTSRNAITPAPIVENIGWTECIVEIS